MRCTLPKPTLILLVIAVLFGLSYGAFELQTVRSSPEQQPPQELINTSLDLSETLFRQIHDQFRENTNLLKERLDGRLTESTSRQAIFGELESFPFWGSALLRNGQLFAWHGFARGLPAEPASLPDDSLEISIQRHNNVTFLLATLSFRTSEEDQFTLVTSERLEQTNIIPIAREQELDLSLHPVLKDQYPVQFNFFDPLPQPLENYRILNIAGRDSAAVVHASNADLDNYLESAQSRSNRLRTLFHIGFFLLGSALFFLWSTSLRSWPALFLQLAILLTAWYLTARSDIPVLWIPQFFPDLSTGQLISMRAISFYATHSIFTFFIVFAIITLLTRKWHRFSPEKYFQTFFRSFLLAALNLMLILFFMITTYRTGQLANIALLDLELIPGLESWILFISTGFLISSITALMITCWWVLFIAEKDKSTVITLIASVSFFFLYFLADSFIDFALFERWKLLISFGLFGASIGTGIWLHRKPETFLQISGFRLLLLISLLTAAAGYTIYATTEQERMDRQLIAAAGDFRSEEDQHARDVTFRLLSSIEQRLIFLSSDDILERLSAVQARFQRAIQSSMREEWRPYSFEIQLIDTDGELLSDYATSLDSPGADYYNLTRMQTSYRQEQIRRENNRPVVQRSPGVISPEEYMTFYRGWIPVYDDLVPNRIIAWVAAAVYVERPDFNKPIRAVLAASTAEDWKSSYYLAEFREGNLARSAVRGIYAHQPKYNRLSDWELEIAESDSIAFISNLTAQGRFRELLLRKSEQEVVKASTPLPGFNHHLFSFFRIHMIILAAGLIFFPLLSLLGLNEFRLFKQNRKFLNRLLDGLAMVTILLLVVLIVATQVVVTHQNKSNLEREIVTKLDNLNESILSARFRTEPASSSTEMIPLVRASSPLGADAIFYREFRVAESTTPQIFQQNLLPQLLPFPVYDFLYNRQRNHVVQNIQIGSEPLLIGYKMIRSQENQPLGVIAIPTFLQSPLYTEHLLETTSYLLSFYLVIIGLFVIGTIIFANRLTRPLHDIRKGLDKISGGDLETTIPVRSKDEIGELSSAYNTMVKRLKALQINLAKAEREAAWKEMARQIAHEIKNPLTPIKLNLQHLKRQLDLDPEAPEKIRNQVDKVTENIIVQIESLNNIASDFSSFAHPVRDPFTRFDINQLIRTLVEFYTPEQQANVHHELSSSSLPVLGSEDELRRTLINLIKNSLEAGGKSVHITIRSHRSNGRIVVEVEDDGAGIPEELQQKIFTPNFSTKSSGTGLGLAIAKQIVEAHNGTITFRSENSSGTTFRIELPPAPPESQM